MDYEKLNNIYYSRDKYEGGYWTDIDSGTTVYDTIGFMEQEARMQEENSVLNNTLTAVSNGAKGSVRGLLGAAKAAIDTNIEMHKKADPNYQPYNDFAPGISESLQSGIDSLKREEIHADSAAGELGYNLIEGAVQLISQIGVTAATGGIGGAVYMSANIAGDQYIDLREQGVDVERAAQAGLMNAPFQAALERVGLNKIFGKIPANSPMRKKLMQVFESAITEGFTEGLQELPQQLTNIWAKDKNATAESMAQKWGENWEQNVKEAGYSALIGGILGGGASGVRVIAGSVGDHIAEKATEAKKEQLVAQAEKVKASGVAPDYAAAYVDANSDGATITVEAKDVAAWMQTAKISNEKAEEMLGVSTDEINQAAANGTDIDISRGNFIKAMLSDNSLFEMTKDGMIFDQSGDLSTRGLELKKELREAYAGADELNLELDNELNNVIDSAIGAGMAKTHAENLRVLLSSRAMIANPENPAEWLRQNKLRFENAGKNPANNGWFQKNGELDKSKFYATSLTGNEMGRYTDLKDLRTKALDYYKKNLQGTSVKNEVLGNIRIGKGLTDNDIALTGNGRRKMSTTSARAEKLLAVRYLKEIIEGSNFVTEANSNKEKHSGENFYYIHSALNVNGEKRYIVVTARELSNKELIYYNHNVFTESEYKKIEDALRPSDSTISNAGQYSEQQPSFKESITQKGRVYKQQNIVRGKETAKGQIAPQEDGSYIVSLFKHADASTVIHETGHYFVDTLINEAVTNPENKALMRDAKVLLEYGGMTIEQWQAADVEGKRNAHEILANAFESYIMEGKAPSLGLRAAFRRFANWLSAIYAKIARAPEAKELTPEVREVFDAMFASREEIETIARLDGIFGTLPGTENLSDTSRAALQDKIVQAKDMAVEILTKEVMKNFNAERRRRKAEYAKEVRAIVEKDILNEPVIQARQVIADTFAKEHLKAKEGWTAIANKYKRSALSDDERLGFDMLAESLGYDSGDAMATDILEAPTEGQMIRERVDALVKAKFPDILSERKYAEQKAREAIYNDESGELVALEQLLIEDMINKQINRDAEKQVKKDVVRALKEQADVYAEKFISESSVADATNVRRWAAAERRAAANAKKAAKKGLFEEAAEYKRQQVALHAIVRKSVEARNKVKSSQRYLRKQLRAKKKAWHHQRHFNQACALLARMGLKHKGYNPATNQESLAGYVAEMAERYGGFVDISDFVLNANNDLNKPKELTMEQYMDVIDALKNIRAIANLEAKGIKDGQEATFAAEKEVILKELNKLETRYVPEVGSDKKLSKKDKIKNYFYGLRNADNFYLFMDNWTDGYFTKHWYDVQTRCANKEAEMVMDYQDRAIKAYNKWAPDKATKKALDEKKSYKELNGISISKNDMIGLLVNLGNEGNAYRLCSTPPLGLAKSGIWVAPDETLNVEQAAELTKQNLIAFLNKYLTKADIDYAQARIDNCDRFWQEVEALNLRTKGFAPPKVNAVPTIFKLADGQEVVFKGGYFPLKRDSRLGSMPAGQNRIDSTEELGGSGIETMSTTAGSSKNRMKGAKYSVLLEPGSEHKAMMDTIHDICYREAMIGFRKVLNDEDIFAVLKMKLGEKNTRLLREQLQTCANPNYNVKVAEAETLSSVAANGLRKVATNAAIMLNLKTALQNTGNLFLYGNSVEGFGYADVLIALQRGLSGANRADIDAICTKSVFLKERMEISDVTLRDIRNRDDLNPVAKHTLKWGTKLLGYTDMLTAKPVYAQAYTKKIDEGATEQEAIEFADKVIRRTLGSSRLQDVSSLQRGSALFRALTMFQGFFNTQFNQWDRETHIVSNMWTAGNKKDAVLRLSAFMASKYLLACLVNIMISELSFTEPFEDDDDGWNKLSKELLNYPLSMAGPVGQMANVGIQNMLGMSNYGYRLTPIQSTIDKTYTALRSIGAVVRGDKEVEEIVEPVVHIVGNYAGISSSMFNILFNLSDVASGEMDLRATDFFRRRPKNERYIE